jgi:quercetin dioxygenase-like cupin family protein
VSRFESVTTKSPLPIWSGIKARCVRGREMTFAVVELDAEAVVGPHEHANEQIGLVLDGEITFTIGGEKKELKIGDTYLIPANTPHEAVAGPAGAVVVDVFAPARDDWQGLEPQAPRLPLWP